MEQYAKIQQILKKEEGQKERKPIYPPTVIQAVFDAKTGASLEAILAQFNSIYVQYQGTPQATRCIIPKEMRRAGLTITYMNMDSETITERAASAVQKDNDHWGLDINWSRVDELSLSGEISVSAQGTWIINGEDTGIKALGPKGDAGLTPWLKTIDNRLHFSYDNVNWEPCSEPIAAYFRFNATSGNTQSGTIGKIQISRDNKTWNDLSPEFTNNLHIAGYVATTSALPANKPVGTIYGVGPTYAAEDTAQTNPIYRIYVYNGTTWVDNGQFTSIAAGIVQETGDSKTEVMSQKATTEKLTELASILGTGGTKLDIKQGSWNKAFSFKQGESYTIVNSGPGAVTLFLLDTNNSSSEHRIQTISSNGIGIEQTISFIASVDAEYIGGYANDAASIVVGLKDNVLNRLEVIEQEFNTTDVILSGSNSQYPIFDFTNNTITFSENGFSLSVRGKLYYIGYIEGVDESPKYIIKPRNLTREYFFIDTSKLIEGEKVAFSNVIIRMQYLDGFDKQKHILLCSAYLGGIIWDGILSSEFSKYVIDEKDVEVKSLLDKISSGIIEGGYWSKYYPFKKGENYTITNIGNSSITLFLLNINDGNQEYRIQDISSGGLGASQSITFKAEVDAKFIGGYAAGQTELTFEAENTVRNELNKLKKNIDDASDISSLYPSNWWTKRSAEKNADFKCIFFSDIHKSEVNLERILQLADSWGDSSVDTIINGGDTVSGLITEDLSWYDNQVNSTAFDVLHCVGNHDTWIDNNWTLATAQEVYNKIVAPVAEKSSIVQPSNASSEGLCYYYKDYDNVRVIVLNAMSVSYKNLFWNETQALWLRQILTDAKNTSKSVICVNHAPFKNNETNIVESNWTSYVESLRIKDISNIKHDDHHVNTEAVSIVKEFIDEGGDFICWLAGHTHHDAIITSQEQLMFVTTSSNYTKKGDGMTALKISDKEYDAFNYIAVDTTNHFIKIVRIGWDMDETFKVRKPLCIDYKSKKILAQ